MSSLIDSRSVTVISPAQGGSEMHRCLRIPEIQMQIFRCLSEKTCKALAQTCTTFYEEAMDVVWANVKTFIPLIKCMRPEILTMEVTTHPVISSHETHTLSFSREPSPEDWKQFLKHAHRVKVFTDELTSFVSSADCTSLLDITYQLSSGTITTISRFLNEKAVQNAGYRLFPRLRALTVEGVVSDCWVPRYLPYLSHDTLQSLELKCGYLKGDLNNDLHVGWSAVAPLMRSAWPCLHSVELKFRTCGHDSQGQHLEPCSQFLGPWFESLTHLQTLKLSVAVHPSLIPALSKLPLLCFLNLDLELCESHLDKHYYSTVIGAELLPLSRPCFSSLVMVNIKGDACTIESIIQLFQGLEHSRKLRHITLSLFNIPNTPHLATQVLALFETISHIPSVRSLCIRIFEKMKGSKLILSGTLFSTLFPLRKLYYLHLQGDLDVTIDDKDLFNAAVAWPRLAELELPHYHAQSDPLEESRVTLVGVQALYEGCRFLRKVSMDIGCVLPSVDHSVQTALSNLSLVHASDDTDTDASRRVSEGCLDLNFAIPHPEVSPDPFYCDTESAQCMAMAIRVMLPTIGSLAASCRANRSWVGDMARFWSNYQRYVPKQAEVSALWEQMLKKRDGAGSSDDSGDDNGSEHSDDDN